MESAGLGELETVMKTCRRSRGFALLSRILPTSRLFITGYVNTGKKFSIAFIN